MSVDSKREQLIAAVRDSRSDLRRGIEDTRKAADLTSRVGDSMKKNAIWWIGGSLLAGVFLASVGSIDGNDKKGRARSLSGISVNSLFRFLMKFGGVLLTFAGPVIKTVATREIIEAFTNRNE